MSPPTNLATSLAKSRNDDRSLWLFASSTTLAGSSEDSGRRLVSGILWIDMPSMHSVRVAGSDVHHGANPAREPEPPYEITCVCLLNDVLTMTDD